MYAISQTSSEKVGEICNNQSNTQEEVDETWKQAQLRNQFSVSKRKAKDGEELEDGLVLKAPKI